MRYKNLNHLVHKSSSSRRYFISLSIEMQVELHNHNECIHTAAELHQYVDLLEKYHKQVKLSGYNYF